jgi:hypothetical protein
VIAFGELALLMALLATFQALGAGLAGKNAPHAASELGSLPLEPVYRLNAVDGSQRFTTRREFDSEKLKSQLESAVFLAVSTNQWFTGLVPVFRVEKTNQFELRRRPLRGQENYSEPLFFALPPEEEPDAAKVAGRWDCHAIRGKSLPLAIGTSTHLGASSAPRCWFSAFLK